MNSLNYVKENSALLIIDMQNGFMHPEGSLPRMGLDCSRTLKVIDPIKKLKSACIENDIPVIYLMHTHRPDGLDAGMISNVFPPIMQLGHCFDGTFDQEIISELTPVSSDIIVKKHRFSGFYNTQLDEVLRSLNVNQLIVCGIATNICVESTIRDAFYRDFNVFVPFESTAAFTEEQEQGSFGNFGFAFARLLTLDEMITKIENK